MENNNNDIVKCPKCHEDVEINIAKSISDDAEVFMCPHCKFKFRYVGDFMKNMEQS